MIANFTQVAQMIYGGAWRNIMPAKLHQQKSGGLSNLSTMKPRWTNLMHFDARNISSQPMGNDISGIAVGTISQAKEANRAESKNDFIHKVGISTKEAAETEFWLELVSESKHLKTQGSCEVLSESRELLAILTSIGRNTKAGKSEMGIKAESESRKAAQWNMLRILRANEDGGPRCARRSKIEDRR